MMDDPKFKNKYRIDSARLREFDYASDGYYFVTICTKDHRHYFGEIVDGEMRLSEAGKIAQKCWAEIPEHFPFVKLDESVVMPNHIHGIIIIDRIFVNAAVCIECEKQNTRRGSVAVSTGGNRNVATISTIVGSFKSVCSKMIRTINPSFVWQPRFYDHVIRKDESLLRIREYIRNNPVNWNKDSENVDVLQKH